MTVPELYESDIIRWAERNAQALREGRFEEADVPNIIEEIEDLARSKKIALDSHVTVLLAHLLKWQFQPERRGNSWRSTIAVQRTQANKLLRDIPSLGPHFDQALPGNYLDASELASAETGMVFPIECPYTRAQILNLKFLP